MSGLLERAPEASQKPELKVRAIVCDQNHNYLKALRMAKDNDVQYRLTSRVNIIHDYVHLFTNIRKNVKLHDFQIGTDIVSWDIIEQFYTDDELRTIRFAPNLRCSLYFTDEDLYSANIEPQVFTEAVSSGIQITADSNFNNDLMAQNTAIFIQKMSEGFNL